jgi:hypothetical protein
MKLPGLSRRGDVVLVGSIASVGSRAATFVWKITDSRRAPKDDNEVEVELLDVEKKLYVGD